MIETSGLVKVFAGERPLRVLDGVSLKVAPAEFVAITGPSGSGKSTLLNLIGTLDTPTAGTITVARTRTSDLKHDELADFRLEYFGFVFQLFHLIPVLDVLDNVMLPLLPQRRRLGFDLDRQARELLAAVGLHDRLHHRPAQLSGGEQQRVAIARALVNTPKIILADEPTGNLDTRTGEEVLALLRMLQRERGLTLVIVTHDERIASEADRVIRLVDGCIVQAGTQ